MEARPSSTLPSTPRPSSRIDELLFPMSDTVHSLRSWSDALNELPAPPNTLRVTQLQHYRTTALTENFCHEFLVASVFDGPPSYDRHHPAYVVVERVPQDTGSILAGSLLSAIRLADSVDRIVVPQYGVEPRSVCHASLIASASWHSYSGAPYLRQITDLIQVVAQGQPAYFTFLHPWSSCWFARVIFLVVHDTVHVSSATEGVESLRGRWMSLLFGINYLRSTIS